ncbi:MAG: NAD(P)H-dependent oxidoreductase [Leptolyngbyaceae cyanobacterium]
MKNVFIINAHEPYPISKGDLNSALVEKAMSILSAKGYNIKNTTMEDEYEPQAEVEKHLLADVIILQTPVNWMGVPWSFKRYMDYVYSAGIMGQLCDGDGRTRQDPTKQYGTGGLLTDKKYMLSLTFNAPKEAFDDPNQSFFEGKGVDDLFWPMHLNFRFLGMQPLETFACHDVMKNPDIENDFIRFEACLNRHF